MDDRQRISSDRLLALYLFWRITVYSPLFLSIYLSTDSLFLLQINLDSFQIIGGGTLSRKMLVTRVVPKIIIITLLLLFDAILFLMRCMAATAKGYV